MSTSMLELIREYSAPPTGLVIRLRARSPYEALALRLRAARDAHRR